MHFHFASVLCGLLKGFRKEANKRFTDCIAKKLQYLQLFGLTSKQKREWTVTSRQITSDCRKLVNVCELFTLA